ncbi:receptor accessory protein 4 [Linnemannia zychae]|nr:receptor accessory protein 4 [Linnemannia zychae]
MYLVSRVVCSVAGSLYPAYASFKAIHTRNNTRLTAWLMYWTVMGMFSAVEFVLDTFIFWFPFYYEIKMLFILWMILPQTQGSIYIYQAIVDPYLSNHEKDIDLALKDMQKKAMAMGMQYLKQAIQVIQNLVLDIYKKSLAPTAGVSSLSADSTKEPGLHPSNQGYFSWAYSVMSPKLAAMATMASDTVARKIPARPLPQPPVNLYSQRSQSTGSNSSQDSSISSANADNILGIIGVTAAAASSASTLSSEKTELDQLTIRLNKAAQSTGYESSRGSLRNRKISLYEDGPTEEEVSPTPTDHHKAESSWSSYRVFGRTSSISNN